jgi:hypothetical protein
LKNSNFLICFQPKLRNRTFYGIAERQHLRNPCPHPQAQIKNSKRNVLKLF